MVLAVAPAVTMDEASSLSPVKAGPPAVSQLQERASQKQRNKALTLTHAQTIHTHVSDPHDEDVMFTPERHLSYQDSADKAPSGRLSQAQPPGGVGGGEGGGGAVYRLFGLIAHSGRSGSGHYTAYVSCGEEMSTPERHLTPPPHYSSRPAAAHTNTETPLLHKKENEKFTPERHLPQQGINQVGDVFTRGRHLPPQEQRRHSPQWHTAAGTAAPTTTDKGNTVPQRANPTQTAYAHTRRGAHAQGQRLGDVGSCPNANYTPAAVREASSLNCPTGQHTAQNNKCPLHHIYGSCGSNHDTEGEGELSQSERLGSPNPAVRPSHSYGASHIMSPVDAHYTACVAYQSGNDPVALNCPNTTTCTAAAATTTTPAATATTAVATTTATTNTTADAAATTTTTPAATATTAAATTTATTNTTTDAAATTTTAPAATAATATATTLTATTITTTTITTTAAAAITTTAAATTIATATATAANTTNSTTYTNESINSAIIVHSFPLSHVCYDSGEAPVRVRVRVRGLGLILNPANAVAATPFVPTSIAAAPVAPTPFASASVAPTSIAAAPVAATPVALASIATAPVAAIPVVPISIAAAPVAPTSFAPASVAADYFAPATPTFIASAPFASTPVAPAPVATTAEAGPSAPPSQPIAAAPVTPAPVATTSIAVAPVAPTPFAPTTIADVAHSDGRGLGNTQSTQPACCRFSPAPCSLACVGSMHAPAPHRCSPPARWRPYKLLIRIHSDHI